MTDKELLKKVFELLGNAIDPKTDGVLTSVNKDSSNSLIKTKNFVIGIRGEIRAFLKNVGSWEKRFLWLYIYSSIIFLITGIIIIIVKIAKIHPWNWVMLSFTILSIVSLLSLFLFSGLNTYRQAKKSKGFIRRKIQGLAEPDSVEEQQILLQLQEIQEIGSDILKEAEYRFNFFIEQSKTDVQSASNLLPILVIIFLYFLYT